MQPVFETANLPKPGQPLQIDLAESKVPGGGHCAQIYFGGKKPEFNKISRNELHPNEFQFAASSLSGVCGLRFSFDLGVTSRYVAIHLDVASGSYVKGAARPPVLSGSTAITGPHSTSASSSCTPARPARNYTSSGAR